MKLILPIIVLIFVSNLAAQTECGDLSVIPGKWIQTPPTGKDPLGVKNINTVMSLFKKSVNGFSGGQAKTYTFSADPVDIPLKKVHGYSTAMYFSQFECVRGVVKPEAATGTWLYVGINEFPFFRSNNIIGIKDNCSESFYCLPNGQQMFFSKYNLKGTLKGYPRLTPIHDSDADAVFISKSSRLPLRPVTQSEVLVEYRKSFDRKKGEYIRQLEASIAKRACRSCPNGCRHGWA